MSFISLRVRTLLLSMTFLAMGAVMVWGLLEDHKLPLAALAWIAGLSGSLGVAVSCTLRSLVKRRNSSQSLPPSGRAGVLAGAAIAVGNVLGLVLVLNAGQAVAQQFGLVLCAFIGGFLLATVFFSPDPFVAATAASLRQESMPVRPPLPVIALLAVTVAYFLWMAVRR